MNNLPTKQKTEFHNFLEAKIPALKALAAKDFKPEALINTILWDIRRVKHLGECTPESIVYCARFALEQGLPLGGTLGCIYMIPYKDKSGKYIATPVTGYRGTVQILTQSGPIASVEAEAVYENDSFEYYKTQDGPQLKHKPTLMGDQGTLLGTYAIFRYKDQQIPPHIVVLPKSEIEKIRKKSKLGNSGPWVEDYAEMGKKSAINRGRKYIPVTPAIAEKLGRADEIEANPEAIDIDAEIETVTSTTDELKNQLRGRTGAAENGSGPEPEASAPVSTAPDPTQPVPEPPEPEPEPETPRATAPGTTRGRKSNAWHIDNTRKEIQAMCEQHDWAEDLILQWTTGTKKPSNWQWEEHATLTELRALRDLLQEEATING